MFLALHVAAYPVAGWLIRIEDGPDGPARVMAILASGAALVFPWIIGQSIADFTRTLFGRSDLELILASPGRRSRSARRPRFVDFGRGRRIGRALVGAARRRRGSPWPSALAGALSGPDRGGARGDRLGGHRGDGPVLGGGPATRAPLRPDRGDGGRRVRRARGAGCRHAARGHADDDPRGPGAACKRRRRGARPPHGAGARGGGRAASGSHLGGFWRRRLRARLRAVRRALRARGDRLRGGACPSRGRSEGTARFGASASTALRIKERRVVWRDPWLMSQLLLQAAYTTPLAVNLWRGGGPTGTVGVAFTPALVVIAAQLAGALSWIALSAEDAPDFLTTAPLHAGRHRTRQDRGHRPADRAHPRFAARRIDLRFALGRALRASVRRRSDRLGCADQPLATSAIASRPRAAPSFPVETRRHDGAPGLDPVGGGDDHRRDRLMGDIGPPRRHRRRLGAQPEVGGSGGARTRVIRAPAGSRHEAARAILRFKGSRSTDKIMNKQRSSIFSVGAAGSACRGASFELCGA